MLYGKGNTPGDSGVNEPATGRPCSVDGAVQGSVIATYLHGPVLARNPQLADYLLSQALGTSLEPLEVPGVDDLRAERLHVTIGR